MEIQIKIYENLERCRWPSLIPHSSEMKREGSLTPPTYQSQLSQSPYVIPFGDGFDGFIPLLNQRNNSNKGNRIWYLSDDAFIPLMVTGSPSITGLYRRTLTPLQTEDPVTRGVTGKGRKWIVPVNEILNPI